jgi:putative NADH-flavin reductase
MHILFIGGSGLTGTLTIDDALARGHTATALVRTPSKIKPRAGVNLIQGSPLNIADIKTAFSSSSTPVSVVIVTLNASHISSSPFSKITSPPRLMTDSVTNVIQAMHAHGVRKIAFLSAFGVGSSFRNLPWMMQLLVRRSSSMAAHFGDHEAVESKLRTEKGIDWVLVRATRLMEGEQRAVREFGDDGARAGFFASVSRSSVARFLVDVVEGEKWNGSTPVIGY